MTKKQHPITVGELLGWLDGHPLDAEVYFGGLDFSRVKPRGPKVIQIEFAQNVYLDKNDNVVVDNLYPDD